MGACTAAADASERLANRSRISEHAGQHGFPERFHT
jgi:hypothetical protein